MGIYGESFAIAKCCVFGRKEIVDVLMILRDPYLTSSLFSLELYWIGCLFCETNHSLLFLFLLILVIFILDC